MPRRDGRRSSPRVRSRRRAGHAWRGPGDWATYQLRIVFRSCGRRYMPKLRKRRVIASTRCATSCTGSMCQPMPTNAVVVMAVPQVWTDNDSRTSKPIAKSDGSRTNAARCLAACIADRVLRRFDFATYRFRITISSPRRSTSKSDSCVSNVASDCGSSASNAPEKRKAPGVIPSSRMRVVLL